jgi:hypothetical protein
MPGARALEAFDRLSAIFFCRKKEKYVGWEWELASGSVGEPFKILQNPIIRIGVGCRRVAGDGVEKNLRIRVGLVHAIMSRPALWHTVQFRRRGALQALPFSIGTRQPTR